MPPSPRQTVIRLGLRLPPGPPGVELVSVDGDCVVLSKNNGASPLEAGDVVESINATAMTQPTLGMLAWMDRLAEGGDAVVRRTVMVCRLADFDAEARETDPPTCFSFDGMEILDDWSPAASLASSTKTDEAVRPCGGGSGSSSDAGGVGAWNGPSLTPSERWARRNGPPTDEAEGPPAGDETAAERWLRETRAANEREREDEELGRPADERSADGETLADGLEASEHTENSAGPEEGEEQAAAADADALYIDDDLPATTALVNDGDDNVDDGPGGAETGVAADPLAELRKHRARLLDRDKSKGQEGQESDPRERGWRYKTLMRTAVFFVLLAASGYGLGRGSYVLSNSRNRKEDTARVAARPPGGEDGVAVPSAAPTRSPVADVLGGGLGRPVVGPTSPSATTVSSIPNIFQTVPTATAMLIEAADPILVNDGGLPDALHSFTLTVETVPEGVDEVRFEWTPGLGAGGSATAQVLDGHAATRIEVSYPRPGVYEIASSVYHGQDELFSNSLQVKIAGTTLDIGPPGLTHAQSPTDYTFDLVAGNLPAEATDVQFSWTLYGVNGQSSVGDSGAVPTSDGRASTSVERRLASDGAYRLAVDVRDASTDKVLARESATVFTGPAEARKQTLCSCGEWVAPATTIDGGTSQQAGVAVDDWDLSAIPFGAVFDLSHMSSGRNLLIEYPTDNEVLDTDWHTISDSTVDGDSGGAEQNINVFSKLSQDTFRVTYVGPRPGTQDSAEVWGYRVRCRAPGDDT